MWSPARSQKSLSYPSNVPPGFDPDHFLMRGNTICRFTGVARGGSFIELQDAVAAVLQSSANAEINQVGTAVRATAVGEYAKFTGLRRARTTSEDTITLGIIFKFTNTLNGRCSAFTTSTSLNNGYAIGCFNSSLYLALPGQNEATITSIPTFVVGHSYFAAWGSSSTTGCVVVRDLTKGALSFATTTLNGALFPTDGNYAIGASPSTNNGQGIGAVAAAFHINRSATLAELLLLAKDPWSFWYPRLRPDFRIGQSLVDRVPYNPLPQMAPVLAQ
jgi:hypothetical protein